MLRASYSFSRVRASASKAAISFASDSVNTSLRVSFADIQAGLEYIGLAASYLVIAESLNRYLVDSLSVAEIASLTVTKTASDSFGITELLAQSVSKSESDIFNVTDVLSRAVDYSRAFTDAASVTEIHSVSFGSSQADSLSVSDAPSVTPELNKDDSLSMSESLTKVVAYSRSFSDAFTMDDLASIGDLFKETNLDKGNVFGVTENLSYSAQKSVADTLQMQEALSRQMASSLVETLSVADSLTFDSTLGPADGVSASDSPAIDFDTSFSDVFGVSEVITVSLVVLGESSLFNGSAFNAFAFNE